MRFCRVWRRMAWWNWCIVNRCACIAAAGCGWVALEETAAAAAGAALLGYDLFDPIHRLLDCVAIVRTVLYSPLEHCDVQHSSYGENTAETSPGCMDAWEYMDAFNQELLREPTPNPGPKAAPTRKQGDPRDRKPTKNPNKPKRRKKH